MLIIQRVSSALLVIWLTSSLYGLTQSPTMKLQENDKLTSAKMASVKAAVFDLGGVLFEVNNDWQIIKKIGILNLINYTLHLNNPFKLRDKLLKISFDILYKMRNDKPDEFPKNYPYAAGLPMPSIMIEWQLGNLSSADLLAQSHAEINKLAKQHYFDNKLEEEMIHTSFNCMFDANERVPFTNLIQEGWELLKWYKKNGYKIYILSNMDLDTMRLSQAKFPELFALVDGVVYSGANHVMKPQPAIFNYLLDEYHLTPQQCIFFDDQKENIKAARDLGFETFLCSRASMKTLLEQLQAQKRNSPQIALAAG